MNETASTTQTLMGVESTVQLCTKLPYLVVIRGRDTGRHYVIDRAELVVGRSDDADISVHDDLTSREHCVVRRSGTEITIQDRGSKNGTFVDGRRIDIAVVTPGATIQVGRCLMRLERKGPSEVVFEEELFRSATRDALTGVLARQYFMRRAKEELAAARRTKAPVAMVMLDVDNFKNVNDSFGHPAGDAVLGHVGKLLGRIKREEDLLGRYGGDEFVALLRGSVSEPGAQAFCERARAAVAESPLELDDQSVPVTVSVGMALLDCAGEGLLDALLASADKALYRAKEGGRDRVEVEHLQT